MSRLLLLSAAAILGAAALPSAAYAQLAGSPPGGVRIHAGNGNGIGHGDRGRRVRGPTLVYGFGSPEGWAYYNNRSFAPDSFNDWWHDRPDRSIPRWVSQNSGCERQYYTGSGWRC
jgi:hypothetical protein